MSDVETFYCLIVGSRSFSDYGLLAGIGEALLLFPVEREVRTPWRNGMPWIGDTAIRSSRLTGIRMAGVQGISETVRCTNIFPPMQIAALSRFGTERAVEPVRAFYLPNRTPTRLGLSMCL